MANSVAALSVSEVALQYGLDPFTPAMRGDGWEGGPVPLGEARSIGVGPQRETIMGVGGPVWSMAFAPERLPSGGYLLAVGTSRADSSLQRIGALIEGKGITQVWAIGEGESERSYMKFGVPHNGATTRALAWCPQRARTKADHGILAIATGDGMMTVVHLPEVGRNEETQELYVLNLPQNNQGGGERINVATSDFVRSVHEDFITTIEWMPFAPYDRIAVGTSEGNFVVFRVDNRDAEEERLGVSLQPLLSHRCDSTLHSISWTPFRHCENDGVERRQQDIIMTCSRGKILIWDILEGAPLWEAKDVMKRPGFIKMTTAQWLENLIVVGADDGTVADISLGSREVRTFRPPSQILGIWDADYCKEHKMLAYCTSLGTVILADYVSNVHTRHLAISSNKITVSDASELVTDVSLETLIPDTVPVPIKVNKKKKEQISGVTVPSLEDIDPINAVHRVRWAPVVVEGKPQFALLCSGGAAGHVRAMWVDIVASRKSLKAA